MQSLINDDSVVKYRQLEIEEGAKVAEELLKDNLNPDFVRGAMFMLKKCLHLPLKFAKSKESKEAAGTTIYVALKAIDSLKVLFAPFLPFSAERLHQYLGYDGVLFGRSYIDTFDEEQGRVHQALCYDSSGATGRWQASELPPGQGLRQPEPLFKKLDEEVVQEELARLGLAGD